MEISLLEHIQNILEIIRHPQLESVFDKLQYNLYLSCIKECEIDETICTYDLATQEDVPPTGISQQECTYIGQGTILDDPDKVLYHFWTLNTTRLPPRRYA
jgi:hypothetical protein